MIFRCTETVAFEQLSRVDAVTLDGPTPVSAAIVRELGRSHGKRHKRVFAVYELHNDLGKLVIDCMFGAYEHERTDLKKTRAKLEKRIDRLQASLAGDESRPKAEPIRFGDAAKMAEVHARRWRADRAARQRQLSEARDQLAEVEVQLHTAVETLRRDLESIADAVRMLWSVYKTAYVENLSGPADSQRQGAFPELDLTIPVLRASDVGPAVNGESDLTSDRSDPEGVS